MILEELFTPHFLHVHHPSHDISTCPKWEDLHIQMKGGHVSTQRYGDVTTNSKIS